MAYSIEYIKDEKGVIITYSGKVDADEMVRSYDERYADIVNVKYMIADYTDVIQFDLTEEDVKRMAVLTSETANKFDNEVYFLCIRPTNYMMSTANIWRTKVGQTKWQMKTCRRRIEGETWLLDNVSSDLHFGRKAGNIEIA